MKKLRSRFFSILNSVKKNRTCKFKITEPYKKDISILARNGFDFETSKKVMDITKMII